MGWVGGVVVAHENLVSAQGPLVLGFWLWGFGVWCLGLTILIILNLYLPGCSLGDDGSQAGLRCQTLPSVNVDVGS